MLRALALACYHVRFYQPNVLVGNVTTRPTLKMRLDKLKKTSHGQQVTASYLHLCVIRSFTMCDILTKR